MGYYRRFGGSSYNPNTSGGLSRDEYRKLEEHWNKKLNEKKRDEIYERFEKNVVNYPYNELMRGVCFHQQDWVHVRGYPVNGANNYEFMGGANAVYCMVAQHQKGYQTSIWIQKTEIEKENRRRNSEGSRTGVIPPIAFAAEKSDAVYLNRYFKEEKDAKHVIMYNIEQLVNYPKVEYEMFTTYITSEKEKRLDSLLRKYASQLDLKISHSKYHTEAEVKGNVLQLPKKENYASKETYYNSAFYALSLKAVEERTKDIPPSTYLSAEVATVLLCHKHGINVDLSEKTLLLKNSLNQIKPVMKENKQWYFTMLRNGGVAADYVLNFNDEKMKKRDIFKNVSTVDLQSDRKVVKKGGNQYGVY